MTAEDRLRAAIDQRTSSIEPAPDGLQRIEERLMDAHRHTSRRNRALIGIATAAAVVAAVVGVLALAGDDDRVETTGSRSSTTSSTPGSTTADATTTTELAPTVDPTSAVFPDPTTSRRFDDPAALAYAFATDLLGFVDPLVGDFAQGDNRSGEVELRAVPAGRVTTVLVRLLEDDTWFVIGAGADSIRLDTPAAGATIASSQPLEGAASAFEGTVDVRLFVDGVADPIATTFVTGSGDATLGGFEGELELDLPEGAEHGILVLSELSQVEGQGTLAATVIRVHFG